MAGKGLGKGLGALFADYDDFDIEEKPEPVRQKPPVVSNDLQEGDLTREIPLYKIFPNPNQPRKSFDETALKELAASIRLHGIISPIIVVKRDDNYMIIAGERRWRAAKEAGLNNVPVIVRNYNSQEVKEISLIENLQREDLNPIEAAVAIKQLMEEHRFTQEAVADRIGKSRSAIANTLRLLTLSADVIDMVAKGRLSSGHARCLVVIEDRDLQLKFANAACDSKMTVRQLEKAVKEYFNPKTQKKPLEQSIELKDLISNMQRVFATKVSALGNDRRGRIYIDYYSRDDLDRLVELLDELQKAKDKLL